MVYCILLLVMVIIQYLSQKSFLAEIEVAFLSTLIYEWKSATRQYLVLISSLEHGLLDDGC